MNRRVFVVLAVVVSGSCAGGSGSSQDASGRGGSGGNGASAGHAGGGGIAGTGGAASTGAGGNAGGGGSAAAGGSAGAGAAGGGANGGSTSAGGHGGAAGAAGGGKGGAATGGMGGAGASGGSASGGGHAGSAGAAGGGAGGGVGGAGGAGGAAGGAGGKGGGAGGASACGESPCKLTAPQCGCGTGQACSLVGTARQCVTPGTAAEGQSCSGSVPCGRGLLCLAMSQSISTCAKFCASDADCTAPFGLCNKTVGDGLGGTIPGVKLCSENCDPTTNAGCPVPGTACQDGSEFTISYQPLTDCMPAGTKTQGAPCNPTLGECAPGLGCFFNAANQSICYSYCDLTSPCGSAFQCYSLLAGPGGNLTTGYGICNPF